MPDSTRVYYVLPSHGFEDFPTHLHGSEAENLLSTCSAPWHPALLSVANHPPTFLRAGIDQLNQPNAILFVPWVANGLLNDSFHDSVRQYDATLISSESHLTLTRQQMLNMAFQSNSSIEKLANAIEPEVAADFFALAYTYLQVQLMTRQLRYSSNLNQEQFDLHLLEAARAAVSADTETIYTNLKRCFELLLEEKNSYYPVEPQLLDLVLLAPETVGDSLDRQLKREHRFSLAMTGVVANQLESENPTATELIRQKLTEGHLGLVGGLQTELQWPLLSSESEISQLAKGRTCFRDLFDQEVDVFFQQQPGLHANLPTSLEQTQFIGAIHATLDSRGLPTSSNVDLRWRAADGSCLAAYGYRLLNAADAGSLIGLGRVIGEQIDSAHNATILFAHWPNQSCEAFGDLIRGQKFHSVLGRWKTVNDYFDSVYDSGYGESFDPNDYRFPFHQKAVAEGLNPISRCTDYWRTHFQILRWRGLLVQMTLEQTTALSATSLRPKVTKAIDVLNQTLPNLEALRDQLLELPDQPTEPILKKIRDLQKTLLSIVQDAWHEFDSSENDETSRLVVEPKSAGTSPADSPKISPSQASNCCVTIINSLNFKSHSKIRVSPEPPGIIDRKAPIRFMDSGPSSMTLVIEIPGFSQAVLRKVDKAVAIQKPQTPMVVDRLTLRNDFFEAQIDEKSGAIKQILPYGARRSVVSQQLAIRIPNIPDNPAVLTHSSAGARYTTMICDGIQFPETSAIEASVVTSGFLTDGQDPHARFKQTITMTRGLPIVELDVEIDLLRPLSQSPFHYACHRIAWRNESAQLSGNFQEIHHPITNEWFYCPLFFRADDSEHAITMLTGGIPLHRRVGRRMVDSLLVTCNENHHRYRLAIGLQIDYPVMFAANWMTEPLVLQHRCSKSAKLNQKWYIHFDRKNILVTWSTPMLDEDGKAIGIQMRCRETEGREGDLNLSLNFSVASATRVNFLGNFQQTLRSSAPNQFTTYVNSYEYFQIELKL